MAMATAVQGGKVTVVVKYVPRRWWWGEGTVIIKRADFVGLTITGAVERVKSMRRWHIFFSTFNGREIEVDECNKTKLRTGDRLRFIYLDIDP